MEICTWVFDMLCQKVSIKCTDKMKAESYADADSALYYIKMTFEVWRRLLKIIKTIRRSN